MRPGRPLLSRGVIVPDSRPNGQLRGHRSHPVRLHLVFSGPGERIEAIKDVLSVHALELVEYTVDREVVGEALYKMQLRYVRPVHFERAANGLAQGLSAEGLSRIEWL